MQIPLRLEAAFSPGRATGTLLALAYSTIVFIATPFLFSPIGDHYDIGLTVSSLIGVFQLGGFAVGSWGSGRLFSPTRRVLLSALAIAGAASAVSALLPALPILLGARAASGIALGSISWFAWSNAFGESQSMSKVATVGPIIGVLATPAVAVVIDRQGMRTLFIILALLPLVPMMFSQGLPSSGPTTPMERHAALVTARVVLVALTLFSLGGSAVYQFGVTIAARELGLSASATAIGYTANSLVSIPSAAWPGRRTIPSPWMAMTALSAFLVASAFNTPLFFAGVVAWGFFYWMAIPGVFDVLASASAYPEERAGDAQAMMAIGRIVGPLVGGVLLDGPGTIALAIVGSAMMVISAAMVFGVRNSVSPSAA